MTDPTYSGLVALAVGSAIAVLALIPVAAVMYRRTGLLGLRSLVLLLAVAIYGVALWSYTLLPLPNTDPIRCVGTQLNLLGTLDDIRNRDHSTPRELVANAAFRQAVLNVALFVPFGYLVRRVLRRGFVVATLLGFATSLLIETTQRSGVWGLYDCAYRVFDVDDLLTNTSGALIGSVLSALIVSTAPQRHELPEHVSIGRRWMAMLCDALAITLVAFATDIGYRWYHLYGPGDGSHLGGRTEQWVAWAVPGALQLALVLIAGRTLGELVVALRTRARSRHLAVPGRVAKWATGVGAYAFLNGWNGPGWVLAGFIVLTVVGAWPGRNHPGLSNTIAGFDLEVDRPSVSSAAELSAGR